MTRTRGGTAFRAPVFSIVLSLLAGVPAWADAGWLEAYRKGVAEREAGRCAPAAYYFLEALRENPGAGKAAKIVRAETPVQYLPNLMLADCLCRMGDREMARKYLDAAAASGEDRREAGAALKDSAARCLSAPTAPVQHERRERILEEVQERCGLPDQADRTLYPWHYDYEASQAFIREGMYDAGIQYLYRALDKKAQPEEKTRIYGMWFTDYHPYFLLAKALYHEGNDECALRALERSLKTEDLKASPADLKERERIRKELEGIPPADR